MFLQNGDHKLIVRKVVWTLEKKGPCCIQGEGGEISEEAQENKTTDIPYISTLCSLITKWGKKNACKLFIISTL